jgi:RimJ/RimL family protein N-acetyltransferase
VVTLRAMGPGDAEVLVAGRDDEFHRWLGLGSPDPQPTAVIEVEGPDGPAVVGWVDHDPPGVRDWLGPGECNIGYHVFAPHRGRGIARRAVGLLLELLRGDPACTEASFLVDAENVASLRVAYAVGAEERRRFVLDVRPQVLLRVRLLSPP